jgi:hypothetical protein
VDPGLIQTRLGAIHLTGLALQELPDAGDGTIDQLQHVVDGPVRWIAPTRLNTNTSNSLRLIGSGGN